MAEAPKRIAVVTGANKGIGLGICRQLAADGVVVVVTSRDKKRGLDAVRELEEAGLSDFVVFHQLDVTDPSSVASLEKFVRTRFGKLDILVNNAGVSGVTVNDPDAFRSSGFGKTVIFLVSTFPLGWAVASMLTKISDGKFLLVFVASSRFIYVYFLPKRKQVGLKINWGELVSQPYELAVACLDTNYYGAKRMIEALIDLLRLSDSPRIVNVSSSGGKLERVPECAKTVLSAVDSLTEEKVNEVINGFLRDLKDGSSVAKGWPVGISAYMISKAAMNAYTRILAKKHPEFCINSICPGFVRTDITLNMGVLSVEEGAESVVKLALQPVGGPSGRFFVRTQESAF